MGISWHVVTKLLIVSRMSKVGYWNEVTNFCTTNGPKIVTNPHPVCDLWEGAIAGCLHPAHCSLHLENKNTYVRMLFADYSSAFNTIVPATLVAKLQTLGLNRSLCSWILDFLTGRSQVVRMDTTTPHLRWPSTLVHRRAASSAHSCTPCTHTTVQQHSSNVIVKFADDTTVIGLITNNDETAYREEWVVPWLNGVRWTTSHSTSTRPRAGGGFRRQSREHTPSPSTRHLWSG